MKTNTRLRFIIGFVAIMGLLYILSQLNFFHDFIASPLISLNEWLVLNILNALGYNANLSETSGVITLTDSVFESSDRGVKIAAPLGFYIDSSSLALEYIGILFAAIIAFPSKWFLKFRGLFLGIGTLFCLNIFRIVVLAIVQSNYPEQWDLFSDIVFPALFLLTSGLLLFTWIKRSKRKEAELTSIN